MSSPKSFNFRLLFKYLPHKTEQNCMTVIVFYTEQLKEGVVYKSSHCFAL